jgi:hypothetical protein
VIAEATPSITAIDGGTMLIGPSFTALTLSVSSGAGLLLEVPSLISHKIVRVGLAPPLVGSSLVDSNVTFCSTSRKLARVSDPVSVSTPLR